MVISFNQPAFIPWGGMFARLMNSERMVLLDDTLLARGFTFVNRNRIKTTTGAHWVTVPLERAGLGRQSIRQLKIHEKAFWAGKFQATLSHHYGRSPWFETIMACLEPALLDQDPGFPALVVPILEALRRLLEIPTRFLLQSRLGIAGKGVDLYVAACRATGADAVLLPAPAAGHVDWRRLIHEGLSVRFLHYHPPVTPQFWGNYLGNLSILDALFCVGPEATRRLVAAAARAESVT